MNNQELALTMATKRRRRWDVYQSVHLKHADVYGQCLRELEEKYPGKTEFTSEEVESELGQ